MNNNYYLVLFWRVGTRKLVLCTLLLLLVQLLFFENGLGEVNNVLPQFTEPIKNMTTSSGSNVELSCYVKHLGNYRVMWLKKEGEKEIFVAINLLKITKNPRVTISLLQTSDDITQSNVYIHNTEKEDTGVYECAVNTNPMISQTGTLEVVTSTGTSSPSQLDKSVPVAVNNSDENPFIKMDGNNNTTDHKNGSSLLESYAENADEDESDDRFEHEKNSSSRNSSTILCSDVKTIWEDATDNLKEIIKNLVNSLVNFTCSFLTPNT